MEDTHSKRRYTVMNKLRASGRQKLEKARAVGKKILYRPTDKRLKACRANLVKANESPTFVRHGLCALDLRRSAPQVGESQEDLDRHLELELVEEVLPWSSERRNAVRRLGQALWRWVFSSRVHWETLRLYQEVEQAAVYGLAPCSIADLFRDVNDLFLEGENPRLEQITDCLDQRLKRVTQAYLTEQAGRKICLGPLGHYRHSEASLDQPSKAIDNALLRPWQKKRPKRSNEASKLFIINELASGTNPNRPKSKPLSPLDLICLLKRAQNQATKSFRFWVGEKTNPRWGMGHPTQLQSTWSQEMANPAARPSSGSGSNDRISVDEVPIMGATEKHGKNGQTDPSSGLESTSYLKKRTENGAIKSFRSGVGTRTLSSDLCRRFASFAPSVSMTPPSAALRWLGWAPDPATNS